MKKCFPIQNDRHAPARLVEMIKRDVKKYFKRERAKTLPEEADFWAFECRVGKDEGSAEVVHEKSLNEAIDEAADLKSFEVAPVGAAEPAEATEPVETSPEVAEVAEVSDEAAKESRRIKNAKKVKPTVVLPQGASVYVEILAVPKSRGQGE